MFNSLIKNQGAGCSWKKLFLASLIASLIQKKQLYLRQITKQDPSESWEERMFLCFFPGSPRSSPVSRKLLFAPVGLLSLLLRYFGRSWRWWSWTIMKAQKSLVPRLLQNFIPEIGWNLNPPLLFFWRIYGPFTLPETNSSHPKIDGRYGRCNFLLGFGLFSDEICLFQEK